MNTPYITHVKLAVDFKKPLQNDVSADTFSRKFAFQFYQCWYAL